MSIEGSDQQLISDEELKSFTIAIFKRHGIDFTSYEPKSLKRRVAHAMYHFKFAGLHELWGKLLKEPSFVYPFMDEISVGLTSMFRDPVLWRWLKNYLNTSVKNTQLELWHAGCSTGEEVYTMGIVLKESEFSGRVTAMATDISKKSIETAKEGLYHKLKMDEYQVNYRKYSPMGNFSKYFEAHGDQVRMNPDLINHVTFDYHNLITGDFNKKYDIVFCRNVMIYFDHDAKKKLFEKFYNSLKPNGLFIIGFYDAVLPHLDQNFYQVLDLEAKIFIKKE